MQKHKDLFLQHNATDIEFADLLRLQAIAKQYKISTNQKNKNIKSGNIISRVKGRGMEFAEVREYLPGDDARNIDWRVTARSGTPHTKVFQQEHNSPIFIVVDLSSAMQFSTKNAFKSIIAMQIASIFAFITQQQKENLNFIIFNEYEKFEILKQKKINNTVLFIKKLIELNKNNSTNNNNNHEKIFSLNSIIKDLSKLNIRNNLIITLSDFFNLSPSLQQSPSFPRRRESTEIDSRLRGNDEDNYKILANNNDLINIRIIDPTEKYVPPQGNYPIHNNNNFFNLNLNNKKQQKKYQDILLKQHQNFINLCKRLRISHSEILTNDNFITKLQNILITSRG